MIDIKTGLSTSHILAAATLSRRIGAIEKLSAFELDEPRREEHRALALAVITSAVAAAEAKINEYLHGAAEGSENVYQGTDASIRPKLIKRAPELDHIELLDKYQNVLTIFGKKFDRGRAPYQNMSHLIYLRNRLVHYRPEWESELADHEEVQTKLQKLFPQNPLAAKSDVYFPKKCLGYGCAAWAVNTSVAFVNEFCKRVGITEAFPTDDHRYSPAS